MDKWYKNKTFVVHMDTVAGWLDMKDGVPIPDSAVKGGVDVNKEPLYVARAMHDGEVVPGKLSASGCFIGFHGKEYQKTEYQVLFVKKPVELIWMKASSGSVPSGSVQCGLTLDGEYLFAGRHEHEGLMTVGKVHPSYCKCFIPFGGIQHAYDDYEILSVQYQPEGC